MLLCQKVLERISEESLQRLREHNKFSLVYYMSSNSVFRSTNLKRKSLHMEHGHENLLRNQLHKAISATMESLDSEEGPVDREDASDPVDQEES